MQQANSVYIYIYAVSTTERNRWAPKERVVADLSDVVESAGESSERFRGRRAATPEEHDTRVRLGPVVFQYHLD